MRKIWLVMAFSLIGCSSENTNRSIMTNAQQRAGAYEQAGRTALAPLSGCVGALLQDPNHAAAAALFPVHRSSELTVTHLSNSSRPSAADKRRLVAFMQGVDQCWAGPIQSLRSVDPVFASIVEKDLREDRLIIADLVQGSLTIGEASRRMQSEDSVIRELTLNRQQQVASSFVQQHQSELAMRQAQAAANQAELAALGAQLQSMGQNFNANAQANLYNSGNFQVPQVQNFAPQRNSFAYCRNATDRLTTCW